MINQVIRSFNDNETPREYLSETTKLKMLSSMITSYHDTPYKEVYFNHNRSWPSRLDLLNAIDPNFKMIVCVRSVGWILDSEERLARANPQRIPRYFDHAAPYDVFTRADNMLNGAVGQAHQNLVGALHSGYTDHMMFVDYDHFVQYPTSTMLDIYEFIEEPYFYHNFDNVEVSFDDYDSRIGVPGLHTTRSKVEFIPRETILPDAIWKRVNHMDVWKHVEGLNYGSSRKRKDYTS